MDISEDDMDEDSLTSMLEDGDTVYAMQALADSGDNVIVTYLQMNEQQKELDDDEIIEIAENNMNDSMEASGVTVNSIDKLDTRFAGKTYPSLEISETIAGTDFYQRDIFIRKDDYMIEIYVTSFGENNNEDIIGNFTKA